MHNKHKFHALFKRSAQFYCYPQNNCCEFDADDILKKLIVNAINWNLHFTKFQLGVKISEGATFLIYKFVHLALPGC